MKDSEDRERRIIRQLETGDSSFRETLYRTYAGYLTGVCTRYLPSRQDARDVLHDSFLKIFSSISSFKYRGSGSLKAWLTKIVVNESLKVIKMDYRSESISSDEVEIDIAEEGLPEVANIPLEALHGMIRELPTGYRTVFNLYVFEEKNHKEISQILNIKEATSASQLHRAKALLAKRINNYLSGDSYYER